MAQQVLSPQVALVAKGLHLPVGVADHDSEAVRHLKRGGQLMTVFSSGVHVKANIALRKELLSLRIKLTVPA
jgi:hypothetical protein